MDCSGAFDWVSFHSMREALETHKTPRTIVAWYDFLLKNRRVKVNIQGEERTITPSRGSPQGGILSPLVWNLVMDSLLKQFEKGPVKAVGYADDVLLMSSGIDPTINSEHVQRAINTTLKWGDEKGLTFNPKKTQTVIFERGRRKTAKVPKLRIGRCNITFSDTMEYLGVTLQKRLTWTTHLKNQLKKTNQLAGITRKIIGQEWGLTPERTEWIYRAIVRPKISYGSLIWAGNMTKSMRDMLTKTQSKFLRMGTQCLRSTPNEVINVATGNIPLDLYVEEMALRARIRTKPFLKDTWDGIPIKENIIRGHRGLWDKIGTGIGNIEPPPKSDHSWTRWDELEEKDAKLKIYTDGASNKTSSGYAFVAYEDGNDNPIHMENKRLSKTCSYQAELYAIKAALEWLKSNPHKLKTWKRVKILTDSKSAVTSLKSTKIKNKMVEDTIETLKEAKKSAKIKLQWIKGHSNNKGNDLADNLAKKACKTETCQPIEVPISSTEVKAMASNILRKRWQQRWENSKYETAKKFYSEVDDRALRPKKKLGRKDSGQLLQVVSGHGLFGGHLKKWNPNIDERCQCCFQATETSWHLWNECSALVDLRNEVKKLETIEERIVTFFNDERLKTARANRDEYLQNRVKSK